MIDASRAWLGGALLALPGCHAPVRQLPAGTVSPGGHVAILSVIGADGRYAIRIRHNGAVLVATSPVSLTLADEPFGPLVAIARSDTGPHDGCAERAITARERSGKGRTIRLEVAACDTGAAFRLVLPEQPGIAVARIAGEHTVFALPRNDQCLGVRHVKFFNSHEGDYAPVRLQEIHPGDLYDLPLTCVTGRGGETYALTESRIESYAGGYLTGAADGAGVAVKLTPRPDNDALAVESPIPREGLATPWRVVMIADRPERMIANDLVRRLAAPSRIGDAAWVRPGKAAWGWWSGLLAPSVSVAGRNMATYRRYIDFAARMGLPYYVIDDGWAYDPPGKDAPADVLRPAANIDIPALVAYGRARGVRLWLWADWKSLDGRMRPVLDRWRQWGVAGIKVDFIYRQDQDVVAFYHRLLTEAARRHLLVDIHAAFVPRGLDRTYPNFLTQEGAMGNEYNRWSRKVTAGYNVRAAYSRATIGPMDYTPGGFRNVTPAAFSPRAPAPEVMTTRAQQLALFVIFPSPLTILADAPVAYRNGRAGWQPGVEFLREVPTVWDETRGIAGKFGQWIAVARRRGDRWYVGAITDEQARTVALPMSFLGSGRWKLRAWTDGASPTALDRRAGVIGADKRLIVRLAANGGAALVLKR